MLSLSAFSEVFCSAAGKCKSKKQDIIMTVNPDLNDTVFPELSSEQNGTKHILDEEQVYKQCEWRKVVGLWRWSLETTILVDFHDSSPWNYHFP